MAHWVAKSVVAQDSTRAEPAQETQEKMASAQSAPVPQALAAHARAQAELAAALERLRIARAQAAVVGAPAEAHIARERPPATAQPK